MIFYEKLLKQKVKIQTYSQVSLVFTSHSSTKGTIILKVLLPLINLAVL